MRTLRTASLLACCAFAVNISAQDEGRRRLPTEQPPGAEPAATDANQQEGRPGRRGNFQRGGMMQIHDRDLAAMLTIGNRGEVEMANFFKGKTQNEKVREFAEMMVKDHTAFLEKLQTVGGARPNAGEGAAGNAANIPAPQSNNPVVATRVPPADRGGGIEVQAGGVDVKLGGNRAFYPPGGNPMISLKEEIAQECLASAKKELGSMQGVEADKCYIGMQIGKHAEMVSVLTVLQRRAQDSQFKEMLGEGLQRTQHHLETAKNLMKQLDQQRPAQ